MGLRRRSLVVKFYSAKRPDSPLSGEGWLIARDLRSGELLYKTSHAHNEVARVDAIVVREPNGEELIVRQWVTNECREHQTAFGHGASYWHSRGVRIFSGGSGQCIQTIESEDNYPVLSPNKQEFALFGCFFDERNRWFDKINKYRYVAEAEEGQNFQHDTTEILDEGPPSVTGFHSAISVRSLDPYGYKLAGWDMERQAPYLFSIVPDPAVPEAQKVQGWGGSDKPVNRWLTLGPRQQVTLPL